jgi:hypothetical protein
MAEIWNPTDASMHERHARDVQADDRSPGTERKLWPGSRKSVSCLNR